MFVAAGRQCLIRSNESQNSSEHPLCSKTHLCAYFDSTTNKVGTYINGTLMEEKDYRGGIVTGGGVLHLGQDQDSYGGNHDPRQSMRLLHFAGVL